MGAARLSVELLDWSGKMKQASVCNVLHFKELKTISGRQSIVVATKTATTKPCKVTTAISGKQEQPTISLVRGNVG